MKTIEDRIDRAGESFVNSCLERTSFKERCMPQFNAYDLDTAFEQGAKFALSQQWVSVKEELPENDEDVLVALENGPMQPFMTVAWYSKADNGERRWYSSDDNLDLDLIRFWMPIPPLPETRKEEK